MCEEQDKQEEVKDTKIRKKANGDETYDNNKDWRVYDPDKYRDPNWHPDLE